MSKNKSQRTTPQQKAEYSAKCLQKINSTTTQQAQTALLMFARAAHLAIDGKAK